MKNIKEKPSVIVVGGGPAGMTAAIAAGRTGCRVLLLERNSCLGKKLLITGNGRCNLTNSRDMEEIRAHVVSNPRFLYSAFQAFSNRDLLELLRSAALKTRVEDNGRIFPVSGRAEDVREALIRLLKSCSVDIRCSCRAEALILEDEPEGLGNKHDASLRCSGVRTESGEELRADWVIVTTGGLAAPVLGSDGDGYRMAGSCGHKINPCRPALVPLNIQEDLQELQGISLPDIHLQVRSGKKKLAEGRGPVMVTHYGLSGPAVLNLSSHFLSALKGKSPEGARLILDLLPEESREETEAYLLEEQKKQSHRKMKNVKFSGIPQAGVRVLLEKSGIDPDEESGVLKKKERGRLIENLHNLELTISGTQGFRDAVITQGGIRTKEIDQKTMASKKCAGLKFAGEILDLDAETGGYNLQIAWSTGWMAGSSISGKDIG
jgi:predicted Rossmann fold flavoprotein